MKHKEVGVTEPKILVISNNAFSESNNNGKTLASFFENFSPDNISQLYFSAEAPNGTLVDNFFQISDKDVIKSVFNRNYHCGRKIEKFSNGKISEFKSELNGLVKIVKQCDTARLMREVFWRLGRWQSDDLQRWLDEISPDMIFFCAGDSCFTYNVTRYIQKRYNSKLAIYITDDYVLPRKTFNLMWWIRRNFIFSKMKSAVSASDLFLTISTKMQGVYKELFGKDSIVVVNMTQSMRCESAEEVLNDAITFIYAGGFHLNRHKTLGLLAAGIKRYNDDSNNIKKACLKIYSNQKPDPSILKIINSAGASEYCGSLKREELRKVLNSCDIPVHVESFDRKSLESTRLSISTKIPEYLSLGKPVLAIGPKEVASMEYLKDTAFCITDPNDLYRNLLDMIQSEGIRSNISVLALAKYEANHKKEVLSEMFKRTIFGMMQTSLHKMRG